jgi:NAD-dependent dihydropyrimidine dehydrogenase PreA subunit
VRETRVIETRRRILKLALASSPLLLCGCSDTVSRRSKSETGPSESSAIPDSYVIAADCQGKTTPSCIESGRATRVDAEGKRVNPPCVDVCPVDAIHPSAGEPDFATTLMLYIDPHECIACSACIPECPESAIFADAASLPPEQQQFREINASYYR